MLKNNTETGMLDKFVEHAQEYKDETDASKKTALKDEAFMKWMAYVYLNNADHRKYGSLLQGLISQYSMGNDQYPTTIVTATDVLSNHKHDNRNQKKVVNVNKDKKDDDISVISMETSFAQKDVVCYCCGEPGHRSTNCPKKDIIAKKDWAMNKNMQLMQEQ